jgi:hypothetical protein
MTERNLILVPLPGKEYEEDFATIAAEIGKIHPSIAVHRMHGSTPVHNIDWKKPTLAVSLRHKLPFPLARGRLLSCRYVPKERQIARFAARGVRVPQSQPFRWGLHLDPGAWGKHLILKPTGIGRMSHGRGTHLLPTALLGQLKPGHFGPRHPIHSGPYLVQSFIDTGPRPTAFRVLTLLGEPLYAMRISLIAERPSLDCAPRELLRATIASNGGPRERELVTDAGVLAFARAMSSAFPMIPLKGCDILKEHATGLLYAAECNPGGNTWHFSSSFAAQMRAEMGNGRALLLEQFDALRTAARILASATLEWAN